MIYKIIKLSSLILVLSIVIIISFISYNFYSAQAQGTTFSFAGWIWSENYGWISLNSDNCLLLNPGDCIALEPRVDYDVKIDSSNNISGYAWSENVGWVCFGDGSGDATKGCIGSPPSGTLATNMNATTGKISGWAKVNSLGGDGWIKLRRGETGIIPAGTGEACYDCQPKCDQWSIDMVGDPPAPVEVPPCVKYSETEFDSCNTCFSQTNFNGVDYPTDPNPGVPDYVVGGSGYLYTYCTNCSSQDVLGVSRVTCSACNNSVPTSLEQYGVNRNLSDGRLLGWSWNGTADGLTGAGWVHFNTEFGSSYIVFPWLQTLYSSIYTPKWVRQKAGVEGRNATYCILAEDINVNIKAQNCEDIAAGLVKGVDAGFLQSSPSGGVYRNALGKIDIAGIINKVAASGTRNKYGQIVNDISAASWNGPLAGVLNGEVYHFDSNLQITNPLQLINSSANVPGNGIIIVDGNLTIKKDISYGAGVPTKLNQLASVVWIVRGDLIIDPDVENVVGAFVVLGNNTACQLSASSDPSYHNYNQTGCGVFFSGDSDKPLTVLGLVIAKAFDLERNFSELLQGSERIIYDGRLTANPPKALSGFIEGLPVVRDFSY